MNSFFKILTGIFLFSILIVNTADAAIKSMSMIITEINFDENNSLVVDGLKFIHQAESCDDYSSGYLLKLMINNPSSQNYVSNSWEKYDRVTVLLQGDLPHNFNRFTFGEGYIPETTSLTMFPMDCEMEFFHDSNPSG